MEKAQAVLPQTQYGKSAYEAAEGAEALLIATEWVQFRKLDWERVHDSMVRPLILDGRNLLPAKEMKGHGFEYYSMGRPD
jgi:UDPglucose 6-dehydrogenase